MPTVNESSPPTVHARTRLVSCRFASCFALRQLAYGMKKRTIRKSFRWTDSKTRNSFFSTFSLARRPDSAKKQHGKKRPTGRKGPWERLYSRAGALSHPSDRPLPRAGEGPGAASFRTPTRTGCRPRRNGIGRREADGFSRFPFHVSPPFPQKSFRGLRFPFPRLFPCQESKFAA